VEGQLKIPEKPTRFFLRITCLEESKHQQLPSTVYQSYNSALGDNTKLHFLKDKSLLKQIMKRLKEKIENERIKEIFKMEKKCRKKFRSELS